MGNGADSNIDMGPMNNQKTLNKVISLVKDAKNKGAHCLIGGEVIKENTLYFPPTILINVNASMRLYHEEIFGPVAPCYTFKTEHDAIQIANDTEYGLSAYCYTEDPALAMRMARSIEAGTVNINVNGSFAGGPFGGFKQSGLGREGGVINTLDHFLETKTIALQLSANKI